ncbi:hypothetical protein Q7P37_011000 [Cladosporium fusiforme]
MPAANNRRTAHLTPVSTPPQPSDDALRRVMERRGAARIEELETENATLQAQLEEALARPAIVHDETRSTGDSKARTDADYAALQGQHEDLKARYAELEARLEQHRAYVNKATRKYEAARDSVKKWKEYVDKHAAGGNRSRGNPNGPNTPALPVPPALPRDVSDIDITPTLPRNVPAQPLEAAHSNFATREGPGDPVVRTAPLTAEKRPSAPSSPLSKRITSSQTTVDDQPQVESPKVKHEPSSDEEPTVVREVNLKRRRGESPTKMRPPQRIKQEPESPERPGSAEQPIELRSEEYSSPARNFRSLVRTETSDLDALRGTFQTPRKRRAGNEPRVVSEGRARTSLHPPRTVTHNSSSLSDSDMPELPDFPDATEAANGLQSDRQGPPVLAHVTPKTRSSARKALHQLSPNVPTGSRGDKSRRRISNEDAAKVGMLAEDDDEISSQVTPKAGNISMKTPASARLDAMLENPTPRRQPLLSRQTPDTTKRTHPRKPQIKPEPKSHIKPAPQAPTSASTSKTDRPSRLENSPPPIDPASEPLRLKPVQHLRPQDFRINPSYANSTYAYSDPLNRKTKAARRCLPGCIEPACCGEFMEAARSGILPPSSKSDAQVLEDMLGPGYEKTIAGFPPIEHRELLIEARAKEFSNAHGRHRTVFQRTKTPPGFWRTDMPSTQEEMEDRRKADEMEREKVKGMWREAMRGDGRWKFRDE